MMMDPEIQRQFEDFDERLKLAEKRLLAVGNLVRKAGIPMLVDTQVKLDALTESHARLYGSMQQLSEAQKKTDQQLAELADEHKKTEQTMRELAEAQKRTEESLRRLIDRTGNGHGS